MSFDKDVVLENKDGEKYKILSSREIWLDIYDLKNGWIRTITAEELREGFVVVIPKSE